MDPDTDHEDQGHDNRSNNQLSQMQDGFEDDDFVPENAKEDEENEDWKEGIDPEDLMWPMQVLRLCPRLRSLPPQFMPNFDKIKRQDWRSESFEFDFEFNKTPDGKTLHDWIDNIRPCLLTEKENGFCDREFCPWFESILWSWTGPEGLYAGHKWGPEGIQRLVEDTLDLLKVLGDENLVRFQMEVSCPPLPTSTHDLAKFVII